jgi:hypothetical protein
MTLKKMTYDTLKNDIRCNDTQQNDIRYNDTQHYDTKISLRVPIKPKMLRVIMLIVAIKHTLLIIAF